MRLIEWIAHVQARIRNATGRPVATAPARGETAQPQAKRTRRGAFDTPSV